MNRSLRPQDLHADATSPLTLADQGAFWVGIERKQTPFGVVAAGQMCVEYYIPADLQHPLPLVMIHGGGGQNLDFKGMPDGRPGRLSYFLRHGYAVYLVDRPGHGRSPYHEDCLGPMTPRATYGMIAEVFSAPTKSRRYPRASLHTQWPGTGEIGDPALDQFVASSGPAVPSLKHTHLAAARAGTELLERIGPAILRTHSAGGPCGWMIADANPGKVRAIIAIEPLGPPFLEGVLGNLTWGITAAPLT